MTSQPTAETSAPPFSDTSFDAATAYYIEHTSQTSDPLQLRRLASLNCNAGKLHFQKKDYEDAMSCYTKAVQLLEGYSCFTAQDSDRIKALNNLALLSKKLGQHDKCIEYCNSVLQSGTVDDEAKKKALWRRIQSLKESGGQATRCLKLIEQILSIYPDFKPAIKLRTQLLKKVATKEANQSTQPEEQQSGFCFVCDTATTRRCLKCSTVFYCSVECQRSHWLVSHRYTCDRLVSKSYVTVDV